jgi:polysaccharide export outer membrane protein
MRAKLESFLASLILASACVIAWAGAPASQPDTQSQAAVPDADVSYIIGPGDTLRLVVLRNPELNAEVPVRPDGKFSSPLVNDVVAVGKTPTQLAKDIEVELAQYVRDPSVSILVVQSTSRFSQVKVVGQAVNPRAVPYRSGMTVLDLVIEVGGLSQFAAGNRAKIVRERNGKVQEIRVRLNDLLNKGKVAENVALAPGDILVVPETLF